MSLAVKMFGIGSIVCSYTLLEQHPSVLAHDPHIPHEVSRLVCEKDGEGRGESTQLVIDV